MISINHLILSSHKALLGAIPSKLRGLTIKFENETLYWRCYFDEEPTEEEKEVLSIANTEVLADFPMMRFTEEEYKCYPYPLKMEMYQFWAYLRWEQN